jgi:hypothetical protein
MTLEGSVLMLFDRDENLLESAKPEKIKVA